jgi:hypothetical protein
MTGKDYLFVLGFLAAWIVLNRWVLPLFGVPTCMGGCCGPDRCPTASQHAQASDEAAPGEHAAQSADPNTASLQQ